MKVESIGRNLQLDGRLREHVEEKVRKLAKFLDEPLEARVTLESGKHHRIAELHLSHRLGVIQATEETADGTLFDAVNLVVDKAERQARRSKTKLVGRRRRGGNGQRWPVEVLERASVGGGARPRVVESTHLEIKPMTIEEAALELDGSKSEFVVFRDSSSDRVSVLYKRKDDNYGLIAPEL